MACRSLRCSTSRTRQGTRAQLAIKNEARKKTLCGHQGSLSVLPSCEKLQAPTFVLLSVPKASSVIGCKRHARGQNAHTQANLTIRVPPGKATYLHTCPAPLRAATPHMCNLQGKNGPVPAKTLPKNPARPTPVSTPVSPLPRIRTLGSERHAYQTSPDPRPPSWEPFRARSACSHYRKSVFGHRMCKASTQRRIRPVNS